MPHITVQIDALGGPIVDAYVGVSRPRAEALKAAGRPVPQAVSGRALIDTGASSCCIDQSIVQSLSLVPSGQIPVHTPSTDGVAKICDQFDVSILLVHDAKQYSLVHTAAVIASTLKDQGIDLLIGRDLLAKCLCVYDGEAGIVALAF